VNAVGAKNFGAMYDTCHAYMCAVVGARQSGGAEERPGMIDLAQKLRGKINAIQIIDCDGKLNEHGTSTHKVMGTAQIDFAPVLKELSANSGCPHDWWTIDLCFEDGAWDKTAACKKAADKFKVAYGGGNGKASGNGKAKAKAKPKAKAKVKAKARR
jgi:sugar phosphate isomerase/epimerase